MDAITYELEQLVEENMESEVDVALYNKIKIDYLLILTIAVAWDLKHNKMTEDEISNVLKCFNRPETGKLIRLIKDCFGIDSEVVNAFDYYKEARNSHFGHTTLDNIVLKRLNEECEECYEALSGLSEITSISSEEDKFNNRIRKLFIDSNDFYNVIDIYMENDVQMVKARKINERKQIVKFPLNTMKAYLVNKSGDIKRGDFFIAIDGEYIRLSPFIQFSEEYKLYQMYMDIEKPLRFKMAFIYREAYASDPEIYLDEFPRELKAYYADEIKALGKNGVTLNRFSQYELFEQEYYKDVHTDVQKKLDAFIKNNMQYGAVRGVGGVGKTSAVFMWMHRILDNEDGILDEIRGKFNLKRILFLSAKTKIFSRELDENSSSNLVNVDSDVSSYEDIINFIYSEFHPTPKLGITFADKEDFVKDYSKANQCLLIIIDDFESLPEKSRDDILTLKDSLNPAYIKILITTRFLSKESKDITVEGLNETDCAKMTDYIFGEKVWRKELSEEELHRLTSGLPLLIWYAKAYYRMGQLKSSILKRQFSGPSEGLSEYLYDNFLQCFEEKFTKNFIKVVAKYYDVNKHIVLQIPKETVIFLCLDDIKNYKQEDEQFYFSELVDLKLVSVNNDSNTVDFSPLMVYLDKSKRQASDNEFQEDANKILNGLNESAGNDLTAVIKSVDFLEKTVQGRVIKRLIEFAKFDESVRISAIGKLFEISDGNRKMKVYSEYQNVFQTVEALAKSFVEYLQAEFEELKNRFEHEQVDADELKNKFEKVRDFLKSFSVSISDIENPHDVAVLCEKLIKNLLVVLYRAREEEQIKNQELKEHTQSATELASVFLGYISEGDEAEKCKDDINEMLIEMEIYCPVQLI